MLRIEFEEDLELGRENPLRAEESRGTIVFKASPQHFTPEAIAALNAAAEQILAGGQWFQLWKGEIVAMTSSLQDATAA